MNFEQEARKILQNPVPPVLQGGLIAQGAINQLLAAHNKAVQEARAEEINVLMDENDWVLDDTRTVEVPMDYLQKRLAELEQDK